MHSHTFDSAKFSWCRLLFASIAATLLFTGSPLQAVERQVLHGHVPQAPIHSRVLGPVPRWQRLNLAIGLPLRHPERLDALLLQLYDPASPAYHEYLKPEQFADQFGPTEQDYQALIEFAERHGLVVTATHPNRTILDVSGSVDNIEQVFHLNLLSYLHPVRGKFYAPDREPVVDLDVHVLDISGLDDFELPRPMELNTRPLAQPRPFTTGSGPAGLLIGGDFRAAYAPGVALTGIGQVVGLLEFDGFYATDVKNNFAQAALPAVPIQTVLLDGMTGAPGGANIEVILDIMMAAYMAPGLSKVVVYEGNNWNDILNRMATDNVAQQLSSSWCFSPINATTEQIFLQFIAQGQSFLQASGDSGAYTGWIITPSDDPNLTVVGGTSLSTSGSGGLWQAETTWSGSGGGVSTSYQVPSYQRATNMTLNGGSAAMRNIPDVALTADIQMFLIHSNGRTVSVGGTSAAAPLWAGFIALANQQATAAGKPRVGFLNPLLYSIGNGSRYSADFHDISVGNNKGFSAASGYDLTTGWGTPIGQPLIDDLSGASATPSFSLSASPLTLSLSPGSSGISSITVSAQNGFKGTVSLTASGLPNGVTASFSPASSAGRSTLTLATASSATPGNSTLSLTGTSGILTITALLKLTLAAPGFSLTASPDTLTLPQGSSFVSTFTVIPQGSFNGAVSLVASNLPKGVTASFSPAVTTSGASTLTFVATSLAAAGTSAIAVTGTSGALKSTVAVTLTIVVPGFSLSATPGSLSIARGNNAVATVTVAAQSGFTGIVSLTVAGLPAGVTAAFSPTSTPGTSKLTLTATAIANAGTASITITGISGTLQGTARVGLTITAPSFSLSASPGSLTVAPSGSVSSTLTVGPLNGFTGSASLTAAGLPPGVTAAFSPPSTAGTSTLTLKAASTAIAGTAAITITAASGAVTHTASINLTIIVPDFSLSFSPSSLSVAPGGSGTSTVTVNRQNGFTGGVSLSIAGVPKSLTAFFSYAGILTLSAASLAAPTTATLTITGVSGTLSHTASINLTIIAATAAGTPVNLGPAFNLSGIVTDGSIFTNGGLDGGLNGLGEAYSANLLGAQKWVNGTTFSFGSPNASNAVSSRIVLLPSGHFSTLQLLATAVNGSQPSQTFIVTYTDRTTSSFKQSLSDWFSPENFGGESKALSMAYRDTSRGEKDNRTFVLYGYSFTLAAGKQVSSVTLPNNRNVVVLAMTLTTSGPLTPTATQAHARSSEIQLQSQL